MMFVGFLWLLVWGGMYADIGRVGSWAFTASAFSMFQGLRALLPVLAAYFCLVWALFRRSRFPYLRNPLGFLFFYGAVGLVTSVFLSPDVGNSMYWAAIYLSPLMVVWVAQGGDRALGLVKTAVVLNYAVVILVVLMLLPEVLRVGTAQDLFSQEYNLPFGLGAMKANGVGRFALVAVIVSFVRFLSQSAKRRYAWLPVLAMGLFVLAQSRSRTSLLGLAVAGFLFVFLRGLDWRFLFISPVAAFVIWQSAVRWRFRGRIAGLLYLTGRERTWEKGLARIGESPFLGWGFNADRLLLDFEHMHNSYLHAAIQGGVVGALLFTAGLVATWTLVLRTNLIRRVRHASRADAAFLMESVMILGFLTARSFFESTAAFYGVDLLLLVPAVALLFVWLRDNPEEAASPPAENAAGPAGEAT
jgi:O-antigen ligase